MKILKYLLLLLLVLIVAAAIFVATRPNDFDVSRSAVIKAPPSVVFNTVKDFKKWEPWNPWMEADSTIKATYPEKTSGIGGSYSWTSKDGPGSMKNIAMEENKSIDQELQFADYDPNDVYWKFEEVPEGTKVTWGMKNEETPFIFKAFAAMSGGMDKMIGPMYEKGLENLNTYVQEEMKKNPPKKYRLSAVTSHDVPVQKFIGYHQKMTTDEAMKNFTKLFMEFLPKAGMYAVNNKIENFVPGALYTKWDEETKEAEFYIGLMLTDASIPPAEGMQAIDIPAGKALKVSKFGNYGDGDYEAHIAINRDMAGKGLTQNGPIWELYVNDPQNVKPEDIQTDIYYPVK